MDDKKRKKEDVTITSQNEEVETIIEELEEAKGSVYRQATNERAVISFTLGVLSILFIWLFVFAAPVLGIVGIVFGTQARREAKKTVYGGNGMATVGLVCSIVGLIASIAKIIYVWFL